MATNKSLSRRTIFLLAAAILYLMIPQNATMPTAGGSGIPIFIVVVVANSKSVCFQTMDCHGFDSFYSSAGHHAADPWKA